MTPSSTSLHSTTSPTTHFATAITMSKGFQLGKPSKTVHWQGASNDDKIVSFHGEPTRKKPFSNITNNDIATDDSNKKMRLEDGEIKEAPKVLPVSSKSAVPVVYVQTTTSESFANRQGTKLEEDDGNIENLPPTQGKSACQMKRAPLRSSLNNQQTVNKRKKLESQIVPTFQQLLTAFKLNEASKTAAHNSMESSKGTVNETHGGMECKEVLDKEVHQPAIECTKQSRNETNRSFRLQVTSVKVKAEPSPALMDVCGGRDFNEVLTQQDDRPHFESIGTFRREEVKTDQGQAASVKIKAAPSNELPSFSGKMNEKEKARLNQISRTVPFESRKELVLKESLLRCQNRKKHARSIVLRFTPHVFNKVPKPLNKLHTRDTEDSGIPTFVSTFKPTGAPFPLQSDSSYIDGNRESNVFSRPNARNVDVPTLGNASKCFRKEVLESYYDPKSEGWRRGSERMVSIGTTADKQVDIVYATKPSTNEALIRTTESRFDDRDGPFSVMPFHNSKGQLVNNPNPTSLLHEINRFSRPIKRNGHSISVGNSLSIDLPEDKYRNKERKEPSASLVHNPHGPQTRGLGRGRDRTIPAWMTKPNTVESLTQASTSSRSHFHVWFPCRNTKEHDNLTKLAGSECGIREEPKQRAVNEAYHLQSFGRGRGRTLPAWMTKDGIGSIDRNEQLNIIGARKCPPSTPSNIGRLGIVADGITNKGRSIKLEHGSKEIKLCGRVNERFQPLRSKGPTRATMNKPSYCLQSSGRGRGRTLPAWMTKNGLGPVALTENATTCFNQRATISNKAPTHHHMRSNAGRQGRRDHGDPAKRAQYF